MSTIILYLSFLQDMPNITPELEHRLDEMLDELLSQEYKQGWISEALFVMALDLKNDPCVDLQDDSHQLESAVTGVLDNQPQWVIDQLEEADLPSGFSQRVSGGTMDVIDIMNPKLDYEFLMYPGDDFFEALVRQYHPIICGDNSLQAIAQKTGEQKNLARNLVIILISQAFTPGFYILPFLSVFALHLVEENIDEVCDNYEPY